MVNNPNFLISTARISRIFLSVPKIYFESASYDVDEPARAGSMSTVMLTVLRSGDASRQSEVRITTRDATAIASRDYHPKSTMLIFRPGDFFLFYFHFFISTTFDIQQVRLPSDSPWRFCMITRRSRPRPSMSSLDRTSLWTPILVSHPWLKFASTIALRNPSRLWQHLRLSSRFLSMQTCKSDSTSNHLPDTRLCVWRQVNVFYTIWEPKSGTSIIDIEWPIMVCSQWKRSHFYKRNAPH